MSSAVASPRKTTATPHKKTRMQSPQDGKASRSRRRREQPEAPGQPRRKEKVSGSGTASASGRGSETTSTQSQWAYPAEGMYVSSQEGFEEFCTGPASCDRSQLPPEHRRRVRYKQKSSRIVTVIEETSISDARSSETTSTYTPQAVRIVRLIMRFTYQDVSFREEFRPHPAIEALRLSMRQGMRWSGRWDASTSGKYNVRIGRREKIRVAGKNVTAFPITSETQFHGDFEGNQTTTNWIDPKSLVVVASRGSLEARNSLGVYRTSFQLKLLDGPGY